MNDLVTAAEARAHLRLDTIAGETSDDTWLAIFIPAISEAVAGWLKDSWRLYVPMLDGDGNPIIDSAGDQVPAVDSNNEYTPRFQVKAAVLLELGNMYRNREGEGTDNVVQAHEGHGYVLNKASTSLLAPLRKSTLK